MKDIFTPEVASNIKFNHIFEFLATFCNLMYIIAKYEIYLIQQSKLMRLVVISLFLVP